MSLIESISRGFFSFRADVGGAPAPWDDFWYEPAGGKHSASGMRITPETVKRLAVVLACVSAKSRQLATLPFKVYTDMAGGGRRVVTDHPLYDILYSRPNNYQTAFEFKTMMQSHVELRGNAFAQKIPGPRGPVDQLLPMHPDRVTVEVLKDSGRLRYKYNDPLTGNTEVLMQDEVFHLRDFSDDGYVGQSRISMAVDSLGLALAQQDYQSRFLRNDAKSSMAIVGTNFKTKEDEELFRKNLGRAQTGVNRGRPLVLPAGLDIKELSVKPIDMQLLEAMKASDVRICSIFNVLPHLVGVDTGRAATYASVEQFNIMNAVQSVLPMAILWEQAIQRDLITSTRFYAKASMASMLRGDTASRFAAYNLALSTGWMSQDDVRELEDLNPIPNGVGKTYWRPMNWAPLSQLETPKSAGQQVAAPDDAQAVEEGAGSDGGGAAAARDGRLQLLASSAADRCVRREVSGVRKLIERSAGAYEITEFYAEQARFIGEVFHLAAAAALNTKIGCDARAQQLTMLLDGDEKAEAVEWIEHIAATEPVRLATMAVEGVK